MKVTERHGRVSRPATWWFCALCWHLAPAALGGPPLVTDDPGVLEPGSWEIIAALSGEHLPSGEQSRGGELDVSYGLTERSQLSFVLPHQRIEPPGESGQSGFGAASAGYKWQFHDSSRWQMAIAPNYSTPLSSAFDPPGEPEQPSVLGLPVLVAYEQGPRVWNAQLGWSLDSRGERSWDYGLAVSQPLGRATVWMLEIFGTASSSFDERAPGYQLGLDHRISDGLHLLAAAGQGIRSWSHPEHDLEFRFYLGLQWFRP